ncbi:unnamed protein product, partial [marine sediment metagenome]
DTRTGLPKIEKLRELDLDSVGERLTKLGVYT